VAGKTTVPPPHVVKAFAPVTVQLPTGRSSLPLKHEPEEIDSAVRSLALGLVYLQLIVSSPAFELSM
jgi:hypothetical protein